MLSYRHAFHAGNFADVMKHVVLTAILEYLTRKDAKLCYIDTHAGAGGYDLGSEQALKTGESAAGIGRLWQAEGLPELLEIYLSLVRKFNGDGELQRYPGSPWFAAELLRPKDRLLLCELHKSELPLLQQRFLRDRRVYCHQQDSYRFGLGLVPPIERRGLVLMDPAYELPDEYDKAVATIGEMHRRFATGTYALWYPILSQHRTTDMKEQMLQLNTRDVLHLQIDVAAARPNSGMYGSAMIIVNPPWTLREQMQDVLPVLAETLSQDGTSGYSIEQWIDE